MARHFLKYWLFETIEERTGQEQDIRLRYSASSQMERVEVGDVIWIVTMPPDHYDLWLVGRLPVDVIGTVEDAEQLLDRPRSELWDAPLYAIAHYESAEPYDDISISGIVGELRFISPTGKDRLSAEDPSSWPQQLQTMRHLQPESASMLNAIWYQGEDVPEDYLDDSQIQAFTEGRRKLTTHYHRERSQAVIAAAKSAFKKDHGRLFCEVCGFDFSERYGELGEDYIEAHHRTPFEYIEAETVETTVDDLAMVCANCHRMLHHRKPWLTVDELTKILNDRNS